MSDHSALPLTRKWPAVKARAPRGYQSYAIWAGSDLYPRNLLNGIGEDTNYRWFTSGLPAGGLATAVMCSRADALPVVDTDALAAMMTTY